eukprot:GEMP01021533.1.p1 GENE.GEMP01021533.1~~GEMP01021533.1.p1  ORF type:complete len:523 (+),score=90.63 GEMP01021533.1:106-1674(+)
MNDCPCPSRVVAAAPAGATSFILHSEDGFYMWRDNKLGTRMPYAGKVVPNSIFATDKEVTFAVSPTEWKRMNLADGTLQDLPSQDILVCHSEGVVGLKTGVVQWLADDCKHSIPALTSAHRAHLCSMPCGLVVLLTSANADNSEEKSTVVFTVVHKTNGVVGEWQTSTRWPKVMHGWVGGVLCENEVLIWEQDKFSLIGELSAADFIMTRGEFALEFRKASAKVVTCTIRSLVAGTVCATIKLKTKIVPTIGAVTESRFLIACSADLPAIRVVPFDVRKATLSSSAAPRPVKRPLTTDLWSLVNSVNEQLESGEALSEKDQELLKALTKNPKKRRKCMHEMSMDVKKGAPINKGLLHVIEKGDMMDVARELIVDDLSEETRIAILSGFPSLVLLMLNHGDYGPDSMRSALRRLSPEALAAVLRHVLTLLRAYQTVGPKLRSLVDVPSYDKVLAFLELIIDARLLDLAVAGPLDSLLGLMEVLKKGVKGQVQLEKLQGAVDAHIAAQAENSQTEPIERWYIPF